MSQGKEVALITDAGTPGISDPGEELVSMCYDAGITVTSLPGACACVTALTISGLPSRRFAFEAFLPLDKKEKKVILEELSCETRTIILYEAPHRLVDTLSELKDTLGRDRKVSVCRELTKRHETVFQTTLTEALSYYRTHTPKGECVIVIEGKSRRIIRKEEIDSWMQMKLEDHMKFYEDQGITHKEAMKLVARDRGVPKREIYKELLQ
jgi:16S rRNA (cytidine1402-2'-O)-methyltransferase